MNQKKSLVEEKGSEERNRLRLQDKELQEISDGGWCLSMHQPWASLLVKGIKRLAVDVWQMVCLFVFLSPHKNQAKTSCICVLTFSTGGIICNLLARLGSFKMFSISLAQRLRRNCNSITVSNVFCVCFKGRRTDLVHVTQRPSLDRCCC